MNSVINTNITISIYIYIWVVVKIMVPFWVPIIARPLIFRVPLKGTIILITTHINFQINKIVKAILFSARLRLSEKHLSELEAGSQFFFPEFRVHVGGFRV